jgi:cellulose synthase (UDP-forming)
MDKIDILLPVVLLSNFCYLLWVLLYINYSSLSLLFYVSEWALFSGTFIFGYCHFERKHVRQSNYKSKGSVDVFVACYNEPILMIEKTLSAAAEMDYKLKKVFLLDDSFRPELKRIAKKHGAIYLARKNSINAKAGNLNFGLKHSKSEFVMILDADQVVEKNFLKETLGFFRESEKVALVTTRQRYDVPRGDFNNDFMFYEHMLPGKNIDNAAISTGSGVVYRRKSLKDIGGFQTWNIVEDLYTSYVLHQNGYVSIYVNEAYTTGIAPLDLVNVYKQRGTWAVDTLRVFFKKNPFFVKSNLSLKQKIHYFEMGWSYIVSGIFIPIIFLFPIFSLFTDKSLINVSSTALILFRAPGLILLVIFFWALGDGFQSNQYWAGLWPVYLNSIVTALSPKKMGYKVTEKVEVTGRHIRLILPQLGLVILSIVSVIFNILVFGFSALTMLNSLYVGLCIFWMYPIIVQGLRTKPTYSSALHGSIVVSSKLGDDAPLLERVNLRDRVLKLRFWKV